MPISRLDTAYRSLIISKFFNKGWGKPENLKKLFEFKKVVSNRETCFPLVDPNYPVTITREINYSDSVLLEGHFVSPFEQYLPGLLPQVSETAYFQILLPKKWQSSHYKPVCLHLAGTGDHFFFRRRNLMAKPLIKEAGIGALLLENPFYGLRKPKDQRWSSLHNVSDIFVMGGCLILESLVLFHWCKRNSLGPFGLTGISMGGHMASLAATNIPEPIVLVPCLSWTTASGVFTKGVMSAAINWELLEHQYFSDEGYSKEIKHMVKIIDNMFMIAQAANDEVCKKLIFDSGTSPSLSFTSSTKKHQCFAAGREFAKNYPDSLNKLEKFISNELKDLDIIEKVESIQKEDNKKLEGNSETPEKNVEDNSDQVNSFKNFIGGKMPGEKDLGSKLEKAKNKVSEYLLWRSKELDKQLLGKEGESGKLEVKLGKIDREKQEALQFMCGIMDECTHLKNFSVPVDTELVISVTAKDDAYVPREGFTDLQELWRGSEVRYINAGHVGAYLMHQKLFRLAIVDAFEKLKAKYFKESLKNIQTDFVHQQEKLV